MDECMGAIRQATPLKTWTKTARYRVRPSSPESFRLLFRGNQVSETSARAHRNRPRRWNSNPGRHPHPGRAAPPVIGTRITSVISALMAWLAVGDIH